MVKEDYSPLRKRSTAIMLERASRPYALLEGPRGASRKNFRERPEQGLLSMKRKVS